MIRSLFISSVLICSLLLNGITLIARKSSPKGQKSRVEKTAKSETKSNAKREAKERQLIKKNPRLAGLFKDDSEREIDREDQPQEALEWYLNKRLPKGEKQLPIERYFAAKEKIKHMKRFSTSRNKNLPSQEEAGETEEIFEGEDGEFPNGTGGSGAGDGSASTSGALGTWQAIGPGNVGGRTRALLIDPTNPDVMYAAAVSGGIWKTTNGGTSWLPLNDFLANIAVTCMACDPSNPGTIYAGTGEGYFNVGAVRGAGMFKTTDAGAHWTRLPATISNSNFFFINDIVVSNSNAQHVYAATGTGVWRSLD